MDTKQDLVKFGLTENEAETYLVLLKIGEARTGQISKETKINRSLVYRVLETLKNKGLVSEVIKENRSYFSANNPQNLKKIIEEKNQDLNELLPKLLSIKKEESDSMKIEVYSGLNGIKTVLRDNLENVKEFYVLGAGNEFASLTEHFYDQYYTLRIQRKIFQKVLFKSDAKERAKVVSDSSYSEARILDETYKVPMATIIYKNKVAFVSWPDKKVILIESKNIFEGFKEQFDILWKTAES